jgi:hypothetical protein
MWETKEPQPVKLIVGMLGPEEESLWLAVEEMVKLFGPADLVSDIWLFELTQYYKKEIGERILRQFVSFERLVDPGELAAIKHRTNALEKDLAGRLKLDVPRPVNLDPGLIEPAKLVLATTKNYSHRIYIGKQMWAEVTLIFDKGRWTPLPYTYPDYRLENYHEFFERVRRRLLEQLKSIR